MPARFDIYPEQGLAVATLSGRLTVPEIIRNNMAYDNHCDKRPGQVLLIDASHVTEFRVTFRGLLAIAKYYLALLDPYDPTVMTAFYAPNDLMFDKALLYQRFVSSSEANCVGVFRTLPECWAFLKVPEESLPAALRLLQRF